MIRRAIHECPPCAVPLQREEYDVQTARRNKMIRFRHAIANIPYDVSRLVHTIRYNRQQERMCKLVLNHKHLPVDLFQHIDTYLYEIRYSCKRLQNKGFSRAVHHLIHIDRIADVEGALTVGKQFDSTLSHRNASSFTMDLLVREFRESLWSYMWPVREGIIGVPELWYPELLPNDFTVWCV
jgi:hypothetical protein